MNERGIACAESGFTVVAASSRLAQRLQYEFARRRLQEGRTAWESPDVLPLSAWLDRTWRETRRFAAERPLLLSPAQSLCAWQRIIEESGFGRNLLHPGAVARQAMEAWERLAAWRLKPARPDRGMSEDARAFGTWAGAYAAQCAARGWQDPSSLAEELLSAPARGPSAGPARLALIGFDAPEPGLLALARSLADRGATVEWIVPGTRNRFVAAEGFADRRAEIRAAAAWTRERLGARPGDSIGIVMPDLAARRRALEYEFDGVLFPGAYTRPPGETARPYSIALGSPLTEYPAIAAALLMLHALHEPITAPELGSLLRSPFLADAESEAAARAGLDASLRRRGAFRHDLASLIRATTTFNARHRGCEGLLARLRDAAQLLRSARGMQSTATWAELYSRMLRTLGWPGSRAPDSTEYQCMQAWLDALSELASLEPMLARLNAASALAELRRVVAQQRFQPRTGEAPVQVMGLSGAADMQFDHLWVMGLQQELWPGRAQPNPFIPLRLQREQRMPHASPEVELARCRELTRNLVASAENVVLSYPCNEDDRPLRPSPLIAAYLRAAGQSTVARPTAYAASIQAARSVDFLVDESAPPVPTDQTQSGGAALFRDQAACPFRSFARHRLGARAPDEVDAGLGPPERGTLVHRVMQNVWETLRDHSTLTTAGHARLDAVIGSAVDSALDAIRDRRPGGPAPRFAGLERTRLRRLARAWLEMERQRDPFSVEACEREQEVTFSGLRLRNGPMNRNCRCTRSPRTRRCPWWHLR
ncbi:MAG: PD-(D/E)XK nuclease family protein [Gammaproteobacteria bacterium]|nr:PD-(D/E)XK nuclease family protein [Gammaproteobacteria bacterium]